MLKLIITRVALAVPQLIILSLLAFCITYMVPGSPAAAILGAAATPESIATLEAQLGLDRPFFERLIEWYGGVLQGDFGRSFATARPVTDMLGERLPATFSLMIGGTIIALILGVALGIIGGTKPGSIRDRISTAIASITMSIPEFWLGIILMLIFAVQLGWLPVIAWVPIDHDFFGWLQGIILPSLALGITGAALIARQTRTAMASNMSARYIDSLTAAGVPRNRLIFKYGFKNALVPVLSSTGITISIMLGASFAIEKVFSIPGVGSVLIRAVSGKDFALVQGGVLLIATIIIVVNLILDIAYGIINPKARPE
ncbi:MAG: ABC transporter permease [Gulosibacter sp.]|uniref:ABC transporter permease n=1 Tax=Gulosibacter sp. TaxID=2817531 RepID=UPI003F92469F